MLDIGWSEMAMIALLALVVIGPKDLPRVMRSIGQWTRKARSVAREFQSGLDDMMRETELDEARKTIERTSRLDVGQEMEKHIDPTGSVRESASELERDARADADVDGAEAPAGGASHRHTQAPKAPAHSVNSGKPAEDGGPAAGEATDKEPAGDGSSAGATGGRG
jgi:sec-independent protein translocase protein TatB